MVVESIDEQSVDEQQPSKFLVLLRASRIKRFPARNTDRVCFKILPSVSFVWRTGLNFGERPMKYSPLLAVAISALFIVGCDDDDEPTTQLRRPWSPDAPLANVTGQPSSLERCDYAIKPLVMRRLNLAVDDSSGVSMANSPVMQATVIPQSQFDLSGDLDYTVMVVGRWWFEQPCGGLSSDSSCWRDRNEFDPRRTSSSRCDGCWRCKSVCDRTDWSTRCTTGDLSVQRFHRCSKYLCRAIPCEISGQW